MVQSCGARYVSVRSGQVSSGTVGILTRLGSVRRIVVWLGMFVVASGKDGWGMAW